MKFLYFFCVLLACCRFATALPSDGKLTNSANVTTSLDGSDRSAVVIIHGWTGAEPGQVPDNAFSGGDWPALINALNTSIGGSSWRLLLYHWEDDASTGKAVDIGWFGNEGFSNARYAATNAFVNGTQLAELLNQGENLRRVVFIAHSAGSWVAYRALDRLLQRNPYVVANLVLLDAFIPAVDPSIPSILSKPTMSGLAWRSDADRIFRLENYYTHDATDFDFDWGSGGGSHATSQSFQWRSRDIDGVVRLDGEASGRINYFVNYGDDEVPLGRGHGGPIRFYTDTITATSGTIPNRLSGAPWNVPSFGFSQGLVRQGIYLPFFSAHPQSPPPLVLGASISLSATASGATDYRWFKDGQPIAGTSPVLNIPAVSLASAGSYVLRARNASGVTFSDKAVLVVSLPAPLPAPTGLVAIPASSNQINLSWMDVDYENGYKLQRRVGTSGSWAPLKTLGKNVTTWSDMGLASSTTYSYQVLAYNATESGWSPVASANTTMPPAATRTLTVTSSNPSTGALIANAPNDNNGAFLGYASFTRVFNSNQDVVLIAIASVGSKYFQYWRRDGMFLTASSAANFTMDGNHTLTAVYGATAPVVRSLSGLNIEGPSSVNERSAGSYKAKATYSDGSTDYVSATWQDDSSYATISSTGVLDAEAVTSDRPVTVTATYTSGGVTKVATKNVIIRNTDAAATYTLTRNVAGGGSIGYSPQASNYATGTVVSLHGNEDDGYVFSHWSGDASGTDDDTTVVMNGNRSVTAHFAVDTSVGKLRVNLSPSQAVAEGAAWKYHLFTAWRPSGDLQDGITPRTDKYIYFKDIPGWITPDSVKASVIGGQTTVVNAAAYREILGAVQVTITPAQAAQAGARWRLNGGAWRESGTTLADAPTGAGTIDFLAVAGWTTPPAQAITVARGFTTTRSGDYTPPAGFPIITSVAPRTGRIAGGTTVTFEGANFQPGATVTFGGVPATSVAVVSATRLTAVTPPRASYGTVPLVLTSGGQTVTQANGFSYLNPLGSNIELVGQFGGNVEAVAVVGNLCYYGEGTSLVIADFTNSAAPVERGRIALPAFVRDIAVAGNFAYVANSVAGLYAVNVSNPGAPSIVGFFDTDVAAQGVTIDESLAYVADATGGVAILDVSNPAAIFRAGGFPTLGFATDVVVGGFGSEKYAFVAEYDSLLRVARVTTPATASIVASIPVAVASGIQDVKLVGATLYCGDTQAKVKVFDVSNPLTPVQVGVSKTVGRSYFDVVGNRLYTCDGNMRVVDLASTSPYNTLGTFSAASGCSKLVVSNNLAFAACGSGGLKVVSVSNPVSMTLRSSIQPITGAEDIVVSGSTAFVGAGGLHVYNMANPANPTRIGSWTGGSVSDLVVANNKATVLRYGEEIARVLDVSNPTAPSLLGSYTAVEAWGIGILGNAPLVVGRTKGSSQLPLLDVLSLASPSSPQRTGVVTLDTTDSTPADSITTAGSWAFVGRSFKALDVVSLSNPSSPQKVGSVGIAGSFPDVAASEDGNFVYLPIEQDIRVINVTTKSAPTVLAPNASSPFAGTVFYSVRVAGNFLYAGSSTQTHVFDISNPAAPQLVAYYDTPGSGYGVYVVGDLLYVADNQAGVSILRLKDVDKPSILITSPTTNTTYSTTSALLTLGGTATDLQGVVRVTWENDRGGGGVALGTTSWSIPNLQLAAGVNLLTVTAEDANGNRATDSLTVTATLPDTTPPVVTITGPKPEAQFSTEAATITLSGSAADNAQVTAVNWTDDHGHSGTASLSGQTWSIGGLALEVGPNVLTVTASDAAGNSGADVATVLRLLPDAAAPSIAIVFPTAATEFATAQPTLNLSGDARDDRGVKQIIWSNNRGGSGLVTGTTLWAVNGIALQPGLNSVTLTAEDETGNKAQDNLAVTYTPPDADGDGIADAWEMQSFGSLTTASAITDTGSTGVPDFLKFAFGLDPELPSPLLLPQASAEAEGPSSYLTLRYRQLMVPGRLSYRVGVSGDFIAWDYSESLIEQIGLPVPTGDGVTEEVTVRLTTPLEGLSRKFLRLRVNQGP